MGIVKAVTEAEQRIRPFIRETYLVRSEYLSQLGGASVHLKLENLQHTGSFKARGAVSKLTSLSDEERRRGCVTASTGNHGAAVAFGMKKVDTEGIIFVPENASAGKLAVIERLGGRIRTYGRDSAVTEGFARMFAAEHGMTYISPYNDLEVIGGQGTIGFELTQQTSGIDAIFVSLGGGGMISGIAGYLKSVEPNVRVVGCSPENSAVMIASLKAGKILELESLPTLSDGTAGGIEPEAITFQYCRNLVDEYETVTELEIADALRQMIETERLLIEGSAAVAVASYLKRREELRGKCIVIVICGGNVDIETLKSVL